MRLVLSHIEVIYFDNYHMTYETTPPHGQAR